MKNVRSLFSLLTLVTLTVPLYGSVDNVSSKFTKCSVWTSDLAGAQDYAKSKGTYFLLLFANNQGGCGMCNGAATALFNKAAFKDWAEANDVPLVVGDTITGGPAADLFTTFFTGSLALPGLAVVDGRDGRLKVAMDVMHSGTTMKGENVYPKTIGADAIILGLDPEKFLDPVVGWLGYVLGRRDNSPVVAARQPTVTSPGVLTISADAKDATSLYVHGMWDGKEKGYGVNSLSHVCYAYGTQKCKAHDGDQFDWYFVQNAKKGNSYKLTTNQLSDENGMGYVCVFSDFAVAKAANGSFDSVTNKADQVFKMSECVSGKSITAAGDSLYVLFTRPDVDKMETVVITYTFTLQEANAVDCHFRQNLFPGGEEGQTNEITVVRSSAAGADAVPFAIVSKDEMPEVTAFVPGNYAAAREPDDFYFIDSNGKVMTDHVVTFADGETSSKIRVVFSRGTEGVQTRDRAFGIRLEGGDDEDGSQPEHYHGIVVTIEDKDKEIIETEGALNAIDDLVTLDGRLFDSDVEDVYTLTNLSREAGSVYTFSLNAVGATDFADGKIKVKVQRSTGEEINPDAWNNFNETDGTMVVNENGFVFYIWGSDSKTGGDVRVTVSRAKGAPQECPNVKYNIQYRRYDRPVVSFKTAGDEFAPTDLPKTASAELAADGFAAIKAFHTTFAMDVAWKTSDPESGAAARADDYVPVASSSCTFAAETGAIQLELLRHDGFSTPERSFVAALQQPANSLYVLGAVKQHTFTFKADAAAPAHGEQDPLPLSVFEGGAGQTAFLPSGTCNLSDTNRADWIRYTVVSTNGFFLLQATNVTVRPASADATVSVYTNGVHDAPLAVYSLTNMVERPRCLPLAGVTNKVIDVCVSRSGTDDVFLEYELLFREWQVAEGGDLDEADPDDDARATARELAVPDDSTDTNAVRTLNGCGAPGYTNGLGQVVNDLADWFKFTGLQAGERYSFRVPSVASDVPVTVNFYIGDGGTVTNMTLAKFAESGWTYDAETDDPIVVSVTREPSVDQVARVSYVFSASKYDWPVIGFEQTEAEVTNDVERVTLKVFCDIKPGMTAEAQIGVRNFGGRSGGYEGRVYGSIETPQPLTFDSDTATQEVTVVLNKPTSGCWTGDWKFDVYVAETDLEWNRLDPDRTNVVVTVVDSVEQCDATDPGDDSRSGALAVALGAATSTNLVGHLNGIDAGRDGAYSDTSDWFKIDWPTAETTCRLVLSDLVTNDCADVALKAEIFRGDEQLATRSFAELAAGYEVPMTEAGEIVVRLVRDMSAREVPISVEYKLKVEKVLWPTFEVSARPEVVTNDAAVAVFRVKRSQNFESANEVRLRVSDTNAVKVTGVEAPLAVSFASDRDETVDVAVPLVQQAVGFWKRGGSFEVALEKSDRDPHVRIVSPSNVTVRVVDASGVPENDYSADDAPAGAQEYAFGKDFAGATSHLAEGQDVIWLNGCDTADWFKFTDAEPAASNKYRLAVRDLASHAADGLPLTLAVYEGEQQAEALLEVNLLEIADLSRIDFRSETDAGVFYVRVSRPADEARDVSVKYNLDFRKMPGAGVTFVETTATVSEAAAAVYVDLVCTVENDEPLEEDATVVVTPTFDEDALFPAYPGLDYIADPIPVVWEKGTMGGVKRIEVPLCNYDSEWEGDVTFKLVVVSDSEVEVSSPDKMTVTIVEKDPPVYGSVGVTQYGGLSVREGDVFPVVVERVDGFAGVVTGVWTWTVGKTKTVWRSELFKDREAGATRVVVPVPEAEGFQQTQSATLAFSLDVPAKTVTITKGTTSSFKMTILDRTYGGTVADYSADDAAKVGFRSTGNWYLGRDGESLYAATPAAGKSEQMTAQVTGPGVLTFDVQLTDPQTTSLDVFVGTEKACTLTESAVGVAVNVSAVGSKTIKFAFNRDSKDKTGVGQAVVSNVAFVRDESANLFGTFTGVASLAYDGGDKVPGSMTLTVSANGRMSGKVMTAERTWTLTLPKGGWGAENKVEVVAKSGKLQMPLVLTAKPAFGLVTVDSAEQANAFAAELRRKVWSERPLSGRAAAAIAQFAGYYTVTLPQSVAGGSDYGSGYLMVTVADSGIVRAAGFLADGTSVSMTGVLGFASDGTVCASLFAKPAAYRKGWFVVLLSFVDPGDGMPVVTAGDCAELVGIDRWVSFKANDSFVRSPVVAGGWYDRTDNLYDHYQGGLFASRSDDVEALVPVSFNAAGSKLSVDDYGDGLLTISFNRATGLFSGFARYLTTVTDARGTREVRKSATYRGLMTPNGWWGPGVVGRGFFVRPSEDGGSGPKSCGVEILEDL